MIQKSEVITGSTFLRSHKKRVQDPASGNDRCLPSSIFQGLIRYDLLHIYYPPKTEWMDTKNDRHWKMCRLSNIVIWVCKNSGGYVVSERTQWSDTPFFLLVKNVHISLKLVDPSCLNIEGQRIQNKYKTSEQSFSNPGWLFYLEDDTTHLYGDYFFSHEISIPEPEAIRISWEPCHVRFFFCREKKTMCLWVYMWRFIHVSPERNAVNRLGSQLKNGKNRTMEAWKIYDLYYIKTRRNLRLLFFVVFQKGSILRK